MCRDGGLGGRCPWVSATASSQLLQPPSPLHAEATPGSRADGRQDARPGARPLMERRPVVFLVGRVDAVVVERKANQEAVQIEFALERADDRNRPAAADQRRRLFPFDLQGATGDPQRLVLDRQRNGGAALVADEFGLHVRRQARRYEGAEGFGDPLGGFLTDKPG